MNVEHIRELLLKNFGQVNWENIIILGLIAYYYKKFELFND